MIQYLSFDTQYFKVLNHQVYYMLNFNVNDRSKVLQMMKPIVNNIRLEIYFQLKMKRH